MHLTIRHEIRCRWEAPVRNLASILRLSPRSHEGQHVSDWWIDSDIDCSLKSGTDEFGNLTHTFSAKGPLKAITIAAAGLVDTFDMAGVTRGTAERMPVEVFLRETPLTAADAALRDFADGIGEVETEILGKLHALMEKISTVIAAEPAATGRLGAAEAFAAAAGNPEGHAHVFIASARHLGIPSRFVSGYLLDGEDGAACHAWAEAHVPGLGWVGFDTVNNLCPEGRHVRVATGFDALAASFIRGTDPARTTHALKIKVEG